MLGLECECDEVADGGGEALFLWQPFAGESDVLMAHHPDRATEHAHRGIEQRHDSARLEIRAQLVCAVIGVHVVGGDHALRGQRVEVTRAIRLGDRSGFAGLLPDQTNQRESIRSLELPYAGSRHAQVEGSDLEYLRKRRLDAALLEGVALRNLAERPGQLAHTALTFVRLGDDFEVVSFALARFEQLRL